MAILCIRVAKNNHPTDKSFDLMRTQVGDIVCIVEDGHAFSSGELNCGQYRFIDVPGVPQADLIHLIDHVEDAEGRVIQLRAKSIDVAALNSAPWKTKTTATKTQIAAITVAKV